MTLLKETLGIMEKYGKAPKDVVEVQWSRVASMRRTDNGYDAVVETFGTTWERFAPVIKDVEYDNGYGTQEINGSLKVVFGDSSWLEREEYDGAENWVYKCPPKPAKNNVVDGKDILRNVWDNPCYTCVDVKNEDVCMRCVKYSMWREE